MTMPRSTRSWRNDAATAVATAIASAQPSVVLALMRGRLLLHAARRAGPQRAQHAVAADDDPVASLQPAGDLDIGDAHDARLDRNEDGATVAQDENTLHLLAGIFVVGFRFGGQRD